MIESQKEVQGEALVGGAGGQSPPLERVSASRAPAYGLLPAVLLVWLCAAGPTPAGAQGSSEVAFDLRIEQGRLAQSPRVIRVKQNDAVTLRWTSDRPIIVHLHGYDIETKVIPGEIAEMAFVARATGRFPVEEHKPKAQGGHSHGEAALVRVEVHPR